MLRCAGRRCARTSASAGSSPRPIGIRRCLPIRTRLTLRGIRTRMWGLGMGRTIAWLARREWQEAFKALAQRFPNLHVETEVFEYQPSIALRSLKSLPVAFA